VSGLLGDDLGRRLVDLLENLEAQMTAAEAKLAVAIEQENHRLADVERRMLALEQGRMTMTESRTHGEEARGTRGGSTYGLEDARTAIDDLDLRLEVLHAAVERLEARIVMMTGSVITGLAQDSEPCTFDPPIDRRGDAAD
jgi:hypothetical protein